MNTTKNRLIQKLLLSKKAKKQNGFTFIELMVVIAIVGVLSAVGLPELLKAQESAKDSAALQETVAAAKTCSIGLLTNGTSFTAAIESDTWDYATSIKTACIADATTGENKITGAGPGKDITITLTDDIPGKPEVKAS